MRKERTQVAQYKKDKCIKNHLRKIKNQKITDMQKELPMKEQERWRKEQRQEEGRILKEMKDNMWKKWRGKPRKKEIWDEIPKDDEKIDTHICEKTADLTPTHLHFH